MVFNSFTFLVFFAIVLAIHQLPLAWRLKKFNLLVASYLFYAAWNPPFVLLLVLSTLVDWFVAKAMFAAAKPTKRRLFLAVSLFVNLGLLGFFKYSNFLLASFAKLLASFGVQYQAPELQIILPVGISFYTFQTLSYSIDVFRNKAKPWHSFLDYAMYVTFFPQLVAGPIVRASEFLPQCIKETKLTSQQFGWGAGMMVLGLFQKIVVADGLLAPVVENVYGSGVVPDTAAAWCGTLAFAGQIFCDFAGYSTCAIGAAMCLGFNLPTNFRFPYAAIGFSDFWERWHISLSSWLREYLYIPLGGNRNGVGRTLANLMITMLLGGLWHGASWNFVIWGGLHGLFLIAERMGKKWFGALPVWRSPLVRVLLGLLTFALVCVAWVFFRADSFGQAFQVVQAMVGIAAENAVALGGYEQGLVVAVLASIVCSHWWLRSRVLEDVVDRMPWWLRGGLLSLMLFAIITMPGEDRAFMYFQF